MRFRLFVTSRITGCVTGEVNLVAAGLHLGEVSDDFLRTFDGLVDDQGSRVVETIFCPMPVTERNPDGVACHTEAACVQRWELQ